MVYKINWLIFISLFFGLSSCGYYSFKGALPSYIKKVAVPLFDDNTAYPGVREDLTNKVVDAFIEDNTLKVTNENNADVIISGTIQSISQRASTIQSGETVTEYKLYVSVRVKCEDIRENKVLWQKSISQFGTMPGGGLQDERDAAITEAIDKVAEDIINNTLGFW